MVFYIFGTQEIEQSVTMSTLETKFLNVFKVLTNFFFYSLNFLASVMNL